jgi:acyl carrier protein
VNTTEEVKLVLGQALRLGDRAHQFDAQTALFGSIPEFDSMAVVTVITALEDRFGITIDDDEITGEVFATVGSLAQFVSTKLAV